ncbi:hypothetical protein [Blastopirellula marina]|uniref:hypothetical protein n=1 Tax=Blastopirellula marina TaxID=124 RepID=UPI000321CB02|nr:hypothetical protein [Blastopirellula marina]
MQKGKTNNPFVESSENGLGIGKAAEIDEETATVEYFRSPLDDEPIRMQVATRSLSRKVLHAETRACYFNPETGEIEVGRVLHYQRDDQLYLVRLSNDQSRMLSSGDFHVRCLFQFAEPTEHLTIQNNETEFWHSARSSFVRHILKKHGTNGEPNSWTAPHRFAKKDRSVAGRSVLPLRKIPL